MAGVIDSLANDNRKGNITDKQTTSYIDGLFALLSEIYKAPSIYTEGQKFTPNTIIQDLPEVFVYFFQWGGDFDTAGHFDYSIVGTSITFISDNLTEGDEKATFSLSFMYPYAPRSFEFPGITVTIKDRVLTEPTIINENHALSVIVDKGILGPTAVLLRGLNESITYTDGTITKHTVEYSGKIFDYENIDSLITTVLRDGDFTTEYRTEMTDVAPTTANLSYNDAVFLVGTANIDSTLLMIAGIDGDYLS